MSTPHGHPDTPHYPATPAPAAVRPPSSGPEMTLLQVLDRLGPSIFAGLLDTGGVVRYANQAALLAIGSTQEQVVGQRFDATPWWRGCEVSQRRLQQALADGLRGEASRFDVRIATSSGATLAMDFSLLPLFGPDGRVVWLIPSARDVSERDQAQQQLLLTRHAVEQSNDALLQVGPDGAFRDVNAAACRLLGMERERLLRMSVVDIEAQLDAAQWHQRWRNLRELGSLRFETSVRHREGHEIPVDVSASLVTSGSASFAHVCIDDLSERRAAERRIREQTAELRRTVEALHAQIAANEAKSSFLASMSHELRTPLNVILGFAQILRTRGGLDERQKKAVHLIGESGTHLLALVNDLLDLSKIAAGRFELLPVQFAPRRFFESAAAMARVRADQNPDLEVDCALQGEWPPSICADETRLRQVLINLLDNAVKFTARGRVTLRARLQPPSLLRVEIEDTGAGMTEQQLARLFNPFEQVGDAQQRAQGTGLGLAISQRLVRLMGGEIRVESQQGRGNLFWFELDVGPVPLDAVPSDPAETSGDV